MDKEWVYPTHIPREPDPEPMGKPNWGFYALCVAGWAALWTIAFWLIVS